MLTLRAGQAETLWDEALPIEVRELPWDLAQLDVLLGGEELFAPIVEHWRREVLETGRSVLTEGRPTIVIETYVRLMVLRTRYRWGYRTLMAEVSDSIHLRRFCRIALSERVPGAFTTRKVRNPSSEGECASAFRRQHHRSGPQPKRARICVALGCCRRRCRSRCRAVVLRG